MLALFKSGLAVAGIRGLNALLGVAVLLVLSRALGPDGLGVYALCTTVLVLASIPVSYGWGTLLLRESAAALHDGAWARVRGITMRGGQLAIIAFFILLAVVFAVRAASPNLLPDFVTAGVIGFLALTLLFDQLSALRTALLRGLGRPVLGQVPEMLVKPSVLGLGLLGLAVVTGWSLSVEWALGALAAATVASFVIGAGLLSRVAPGELKTAAVTFCDRSWFASASIFSGSAGITLLNAHTDLLLLGALGSVSDVGQYRVALQVALAGGLVYTALNMIAVQRFAAARAADDIADLQKTATATARIAFAFALPLPLILWFAGDWLVPALFGEAFAPALAPMLILSGAQVLNAGAGMARSLLMMSGNERQVMMWSAAGLIVNAALCAVLIPHYGATGAALAHTASLAIWNGGVWFSAWRREGVEASILGICPRN